MSQQTESSHLFQSSSKACAVALTVAVMATLSACAKAPEPAVVAVDTKPVPCEAVAHAPMDGMSMTGDMDYDFAANMRKHHQMAVDMSQAQLRDSKDAKLQQMARDMIAAQNKEIAAFDAWLAAHPKH